MMHRMLLLFPLLGQARLDLGGNGDKFELVRNDGTPELAWQV